MSGMGVARGTGVADWTPRDAGRARRISIRCSKPDVNGRAGDHHGTAHDLSLIEVMSGVRIQEAHETRTHLRAVRRSDPVRKVKITGIATGFIANAPALCEAAALQTPVVYTTKPLSGEAPRAASAPMEHHDGWRHR